MKWLREPKFVIVLVAVASLLLAFDSGLFSSASKTPATTKGSTTGKPKQLKKADPSTSPPKKPQAALLPSQGRLANKQEIKANALQWLTQTQRDPFQEPILSSGMGGADKHLFVNAIWRQTDKSLALINQQLLTTGDEILGYTILRMENQRVWVKGPQGAEVITLGTPPQTPAPAPSSIAPTPLAQGAPKTLQ